MNTFRTWMMLSIFCVVSGSAVPVVAQEERNVALYNPEEGIALRGFDPVSYFEEGGGQPLRGTLELVYGGVTYKFASVETRELFLSRPEKYEPTYGRWCAFAMASGSYVDIKPEIYSLHGNRLHFFVSQRAKRNFDADVAGFEANADAHWERLSGEKPRL
jgi:YHS domain-containing protein